MTSIDFRLKKLSKEKFLNNLFMFEMLLFYCLIR